MAELNSTHDLDRIGSLPLTISVKVCQKTLKLTDLLNWTPGTVLAFDQPRTSPLTVSIGSHKLGEGQAVKVGSRLGIRLQTLRQ